MQTKIQLFNILWRKNTAFILIFFLTACGNPSATDISKAGKGYVKTQDLQVVDCLLPGSVNRLGGMAYVTERRPVKTTASDCNIRGGEYVDYDRADYRSALNVWLTPAKNGHADAQNYVGEIFEKGLGQNVDYSTAALWYQKAAKQGHSRAQMNLGYLYEKGLGVEKDLKKALEYFRLSTDEEELVFAEEARVELEKTRRELQGRVEAAVKEAQVLLVKLEETEKQRAIEKEKNDSVAQLYVLQNLYAKSQEQIKALNLKIASLPQIGFRNVDTPDVIEPKQILKSDPLQFNNIEFGRYFALIIGNEKYRHFDDLESPHKDALRMKEVLESRYGFSTMMLLDADENEILKAFDDLYYQIGPEDNLLVFYAGHGDLSESENSRRKRGYWLPTNAEPMGLRNWISNSVISDHLDRIKARSVLVVADSCFAGNLASEKSAFLLGGVSVSLSKRSIELGLSRRSRIVISSGGEKPVMDGINGEHSIFANSLIDLLERNESILREDMLFSRVSVNVRQRAKLSKVDQTPEMRPIRSAGHEGGDFFFIPAI